MTLNKIKILEDKIRENLGDLGLVNEYVDKTLKAQSTKEILVSWT